MSFFYEAIIYSFGGLLSALLKVTFFATISILLLFSKVAFLK